MKGYADIKPTSLQGLGFVKYSENDAKIALEEYLKTVMPGNASGMIVKQGDDFYIISNQAPASFLKEYGLEIVLTPSLDKSPKSLEDKVKEDRGYWSGKAEFMVKHGKTFHEW